MCVGFNYLYTNKLLGYGKLLTALLDKLAAAPFAKAWTLHALTKSSLGAEELSVLLGLNGHIVEFHDEIGGQLTPAGNHLCTLLIGIEVEVLQSLGLIGVVEAYRLVLNGLLLLEIAVLQRVSDGLQGGEHL